MRVPVLATFPSKDPLIESAMSANESQRFIIREETLSIPPGMTIDPNAVAIPLGSNSVSEGSLAQQAPEQSEYYAISAFIDVDDPAEIPEQVEGVPVHSNPVINRFLTCGGTAPVGTSSTVGGLLQTDSLASEGLDGSNVAIAIFDTGINVKYLNKKLGKNIKFDSSNSWKGVNADIPPGMNAPDHGTMCGYDALISAPNATLLDYPILASSAPGGNITGRSLSVAFQALAHLISLWAIGFSSGGTNKYDALVVSNSWGIFHPSWDFPSGHPGRYIDNPNHPFNILISSLARTGSDIIFAAGNCGSECADSRCQGRAIGSIMGANASSDVLTVAGCDVNKDRVGYSSQGPSIPGMFAQKPDITGYTHFKGSEVFGTGSPDSGTSAACPVVAGCVAALRTRVRPSAHSPGQMFSALRSTSNQPDATNGWNPDYGFGIIDPIAALQFLN